MVSRLPARALHGFVVSLALLGSVLAVVTVPSAQALLHSGTIGANETWFAVDNPHVVVGDVTVAAGVTLTIEAGAEVYVDGGLSIFVNGFLRGDGGVMSRIKFLPMSPADWRGISILGGGNASITWASFAHGTNPVYVEDAAPTLAFNEIQSFNVGVELVRSTGAQVVWNTIGPANALKGTTGVIVDRGNALVLGNFLMDAERGIDASNAVLRAEANTVDSVTSAGIYVVGGTPTVLNNTLNNLTGIAGAGALGPGLPGGAGGIAAGIVADGANAPIISGNLIGNVRGGSGGSGGNNPSGSGGAGGSGGSALGLVVANSQAVTVSGNVLFNVTGGAGGRGGSGSGAAGGAGGPGTSGLAIYLALNRGASAVDGNEVWLATGGRGGNGGSGAPIGSAGAGGSAIGLQVEGVENATVTGNGLHILQGGGGGDTAGASPGGAGGSATGILTAFVRGVHDYRDNVVNLSAGGAGGISGSRPGPGGDVTGLIAWGDGVMRNETYLTNNTLEQLTGGPGGGGVGAGASGGGAGGIVAAQLTVHARLNDIANLTGGPGGDALSGTGGAGGSVLGVALSSDTADSELDVVATLTRGSPGAGGSPAPGVAFGVYAVGTDSARTGAVFTNLTDNAPGSDYDMYLAAYTEAITLNATFDGAKVFATVSANLTVQNFLAVRVLWPDGLSPVQGAAVDVLDNAALATTGTTNAAGGVSWIVVTDRVYVESSTATENSTDAGVSYGPYAFAGDPRAVDMSSSRTEVFVMVDSDAPASTLAALPLYTATSVVAIPFDSVDGNGTGVANVTLWYDLDGTGWNPYGVEIGSTGTFSFDASLTGGDGTYAFGSVATDNAGNPEPGPANKTWTIVDTTLPTSRVDPLPTYVNTTSVTVSWAPEAGVTDIATYTIQFNENGGGWTDWLADTTATSGSFAATPGSLHEFRSIAKDRAGNVELPPATNDTWTIVDTSAPFSRVLPLSTYQTSLTFPVSWGPQFDTLDIASYTIQVNDNGTGWVNWLVDTASTTANFAGLDGHTYEYRSIAKDRAGNWEVPPAGNDTWTVVDVTPPSSAVAALSVYATSLVVALTWAPAGSTDIATYTIQISDDGGPFVDWAPYTDTTATSGTFPGQDGHTYAFRSIARDRAGNLESKSGNDTWTIVDVTAPSSVVLPLAVYTNSTSIDLTWAATANATDLQDFTIWFRDDGGPWTPWSAANPTTATSGTFAGLDGHLYEFRAFARDRAGNVESKSGNDTWTIVDVTPPESTVNPLSRWQTSEAFPVTWGSTSPDAATYTIEFNDDGVGWSLWPGHANTTATSDTFIGVNGHTYAFRSFAVDRAGNLEPLPSGNDTYTTVDTTPPSVVRFEPSGTEVAVSSLIRITFSEPMDRVPTEAAIDVTPSATGSFAWNGNRTILTFVPDEPLAADKVYFVVVGATGRDRAGNLVVPDTFQFSTAAAPAPPAFDLIWVLPIIAAGVVAGLLLLVFARRRRKEEAPEGAVGAAATQAVAEESIIEDVFLLYRDGLLISHQTRRLKPDVDSDILSGMLTAVQQFVKDSFGSSGEGELDELKFGEMRIMIGRGRRLILAAMVSGSATVSMKSQIQESIEEMEANQWDRLETWDGNVDVAKKLQPYLKKLIQGQYG